MTGAIQTTQRSSIKVSRGCPGASERLFGHPELPVWIREPNATGSFEGFVRNVSGNC